MSAANVVKNLNNKPFNCGNRIKFGWFSHFFLGWCFMFHENYILLESSFNIIIMVGSL